jgi:hypothetical protein
MGKQGGLMTKVDKCIPLQGSPPFDRFTQLVMDVQLGHVFATNTHALKSQSLRSMEYTDLYCVRGFAFAPLVANFWGVLGPDVLWFLWAVADPSHAARNAISFPLDRYSSLSPPSSSEHAAPSEAQLLAFRILRGCLNLDFAFSRPLMKLLLGRTHALATLPSTWSSRLLLVLFGC